jgi:putative nucleotidyltransferase with HDIG domain
MNDIKTIIRDIDKLKPIPQVAHKIMAIAEDPKSSMADISEIIIYDQALTANILRICNSAYFGLAMEVDSVHQAIVYLGLDQLVDIVLLNSGSDSFKGKHEGYDLNEGELWRYSVSSALIAKELADKKGAKSNHLIFTAALVKDIGKVVLSQYVADSMEKIHLLVSEENLSFREAEKEVIGIDHAELGGLVAEKWQFSPKMIEIIQNHHFSTEPKVAGFETSIVYLADNLCMMMGIGVGSDGLAYRFRGDVARKLGFSEKDFQEVMAGFGETFHHVEELLRI